MDTDPPDPGGGYENCNVLPQTEGSLNNNRKRSNFDHDYTPHAFIKKSGDLPIPSVQSTYVSPEFTSRKNKYEDSDAPFLVHVSKKENEPSSGVSLRPIHFGYFLSKNNIKNVLADGVKHVGRNRISVEFKSATDANSFLELPTLTQYNYEAVIPSYNITRMGIIRNMPTEWSLEEIVEELNSDLPLRGLGKIVRARRLNRKVRNDDGTPSWVPTQSVVLTFSGQRLPEYVYGFFNSIPVETYLLPTIQCNKCCRFGHVKSQCRSKPRCFICSQPHEGEACDKTSPTCLFCSGSHRANDQTCPEFDRQKKIKYVMSTENKSYQEASARYPRTGMRSYSGTTSKVPTIVCSSQASSPRIPQKTSYRKTVFTPRRTSTPASSPGYDRRAHQRLTESPSSSLSNGCAISNTTISTSDSSMPKVNEVSSVLNFFSRLSEVDLPNNLREKLTQLLFSLPDGSSHYSAMELS